MSEVLNKYFFYKQISFLYLLIFSVIFNTLLVYFFYFLNDKEHLVFVFEGDWKSSWESILNSNCDYYEECKLEAPYPLAYFLKYLELYYRSALYGAIIIYSLLLALTAFYIQKLINLVSEKYSFICMIYFLFSPTSFLVIATFYKESYYVLSLLSLFLSLISFYLSYNDISNKKLFFSFLYFIFSIFLIYVSRPFGIHVITFLTSSSFIVFVVVNIFVSYKNFWKILWFKAIYVFISLILSLNLSTEGIGYINNNHIYKIPMNFSMQLFSEELFSNKQIVNEEIIDKVDEKIIDEVDEEIIDEVDEEIVENIPEKPNEVEMTYELSVNQIEPLNLAFSWANKITRGQMLDAEVYGDNASNSSYFREKSIGFFDYLYFGLISPDPVTIIKSMNVKLKQTSKLIYSTYVVKCLLIIEMLISYICLFFLLMNLFKKNNYIILILIIFSLELIFITVAFESYIGTLTRHRFFPWKVINVFGLIFFIDYLFNSKKSA